MKGKFPWKDMLVLGGALAAAIAGVAAIQAVSGRIDGVASMVFVLAAFFVSMYTLRSARPILHLISLCRKTCSRVP